MTRQEGLSTIIVNGNEYLWRVERNPQWCSADGWRGMLLHVEPGSSDGRALNIELPFERKDHRSTPHRQRPKITLSMVSMYIREALEAGWDPTSRGKVFQYTVEKKQ